MNDFVFNWMKDWNDNWNRLEWIILYLIEWGIEMVV